ncbi:MAG: pseudouridine synthase [Methanomicrobiales archaeon]|jgi:uncharacterized protein with predicted RNA binding PUA domain|nr:pseudouridine synthase [Methanomicrobiales archaeon]
MLQRVRTIADFQFGAGSGTGVFPDSCCFTLSRSGRIRQITDGGVRIATIRAADGRLTLGIEGAVRLHNVLAPPQYRIGASMEVASFIREGKTLFARHVTDADPAIRPGDEVLVVAGQDELLACGVALLSGPDILDFKYGPAVTVRHGR